VYLVGVGEAVEGGTQEERDGQECDDESLLLLLKEGSSVPLRTRSAAPSSDLHHPPRQTHLSCRAPRHNGSLSAHTASPRTQAPSAHPPTAPRPPPPPAPSTATSRARCTGTPQPHRRQRARARAQPRQRGRRRGGRQHARAVAGRAHPAAAHPAPRPAPASTGSGAARGATRLPPRSPRASSSPRSSAAAAAHPAAPPEPPSRHPAPRPHPAAVSRVWQPALLTSRQSRTSPYPGTRTAHPA
jgi:hypothetical protein